MRARTRGRPARTQYRTFDDRHHEKAVATEELVLSDSIWHIRDTGYNETGLIRNIVPEAE
jgi:hypothetical protein